MAPFTAAAVVGFAIWTHVTSTTTFFLRPLELLAILAVLAAVWLVYAHRDGFAFTATAITIASCIASIFVGLYPNVMVSSTNPAYNLTVHNTASTPYSLKAMTVVVAHLPAGGARLPDLVATTYSAGASAGSEFVTELRPPCTSRPHAWRPGAGHLRPTRKDLRHE